MKNIYFIDEHNSSLYNGIGTFRDQFFFSFGENTEVNLFLVSLNSSAIDFKKQQRKNYIEYIVPFVNNGNWQISGGLICPVFNTFIEDSASNVFIVNHSPCGDFLKYLKGSFPLSKVVFVIHDQSWCGPLLGSKSTLKKIIYDEVGLTNVFAKNAESIKNAVSEERKIYSSVDAVVCLSTSTAEILRSIYKIDEKKIHHIPNGYSPLVRLSCDYKDEIRNELGLNIEDKIIIFAGRPAKYKGIEALMIALNKLRSKKNLKCVFCGPMNGFGAYSQLISPIASKLIFTGQLPKEQLFRWYYAADFGVVPSYSEQFGYSAIEMADCGLPLIVSDGNGFCDIFRDGENAFVASIGDVTDVQKFGESLSQKMEQALYTSPEGISEIVECAYNTIVRRFSTKVMAEKYAQLLITMIR